jgi:serine/threonine protein phosphatase PrpC
MDEVRQHLATVCGGTFAAPTMEVEDRGAVLTFYSEAGLTTAYAGSTVPAGCGSLEELPSALTHETPADTYTPPTVCGDHIAMFRTDNAYFYALISDGMGTGENASLTSDICAVFLEKMLRAGNKVDISLRMLDNYVYSKNAGTKDECSATVDLMELDLMDGQAVFAKNGAAPTYVVREGKVYKLHASSLPIGILPDTPRELLRFRTHPGDVVVMVSDGVTLGNDECPWLMDLLASPLPLSMDSLRMDIIKRALTAGSEDDLSAIAIRVEER